MPNDLEKETEIKNAQDLLELLDGQREKAPSSEEFLAFQKKFERSRPGGFNEGVKDCIEMTNTLWGNRDEVFENKFSGCFDGNSLLDVWNEQHPNKKIMKQHLLLEAANAKGVQLFSPFSQTFDTKKGIMTLSYEGSDPSGALDALVKGPSIIDSNMFIEIALWFGVRAVLGNAYFNQKFGNKSFQLSDRDLTDDLLALLDPFLISETNDDSSSTLLELCYFGNDSNYKFKHLAGSGRGMNCFKIGNTYSTFSPAFEKSTGITKEEITKRLINDFNRDQDGYDKRCIDDYECKGDDKYPWNWLFTYAQVAEQSKSLANQKIDSTSFVPAYSRVFTLNVEKLQCFLPHKKSESNIAKIVSLFTFYGVDDINIIADINITEQTISQQFINKS